VVAKTNKPPKPKQIDLKTLKLTQQIKDQLELKYYKIQQVLKETTRGSNIVHDQEVFGILKKVEVPVGLDDIESFSEYLRQTRDQLNNTINFIALLDHFGVSINSSTILLEVHRQLKAFDLDEILPQ
jgi:hypothetical protein